MGISSSRDKQTELVSENILSYEKLFKRNITEMEKTKLEKTVLLCIKMYNISGCNIDHPSYSFYNINNITKLAFNMYKNYNKNPIGYDKRLIRLCKVAFFLNETHNLEFDFNVMKELYNFMKEYEDTTINLHKQINQNSLIELFSKGFIKHLNEKKLPIQKFINSEI